MQSEQKNLILITDGGEEENIEELSSIIQNANISLTILGLGSRQGSTIENTDGSLLKDKEKHLVKEVAKDMEARIPELVVPKIASHIIIHGKRDIYLELTKNKLETKEKEDEADRFAANFLIPLNAWRKFISTGDYQNKTAVENFAQKQGISSAIVVGRLQHEILIPHNRLNGLRRRFEIRKSS